MVIDMVLLQKTMLMTMSVTILVPTMATDLNARQDQTYIDNVRTMANIENYY